MTVTNNYADIRPLIKRVTKYLTAKFESALACMIRVKQIVREIRVRRLRRPK